MSVIFGIQSVIFYVLSCSTCSKISHRHKAKAIAKRDIAEKERLETEQPGLYHHPSPFNTNPFWDEEISLGPGPPSRKGGSKNASSRALHTGRTSSMAASDAALSSQAPSSPTMAGSDARLSGEDWNRHRYQRADEELWGADTFKAGQRIVRDAFATAQVSVGSRLRAMEERLKFGTVREEEPHHPYFVSRNPPVNDLHPPVVSSHPREKGGMDWMLQPPPSARIMSGKERAAVAFPADQRSRSGSSTPSLSLGRHATARGVEDRLRRGDTPPDPELRALSRKMAGASPDALQPARARSHSAASTMANTLSEEPEDERGHVPTAPLFSAVAGRRLSRDSIEDVALASAAPGSAGLGSRKGRRIEREAALEREARPLRSLAQGRPPQPLPATLVRVKGRESHGDLRMSEEVEVV